MSVRKYSAIVFDLGNVLLPFDYTKTIKRMNSLEPGLGDNFYEFYNKNYHIHRDFEKGKISEADFIKIMLSVVDNKLDAETFCDYYSDIFSLNKNVISLLPDLKKNYKLFLLSNTDSIHKRYRWEKYDFLKFFDHIILSFEVGAVKPEKSIYRSVEKVSAFPSGEHFYIDDIQEYVDAAKELGWDAVRFENYERLNADLEEREII
ncbi:MAG: HAD family phosphatase [Ignavibacteria bacterium]|nr:HAD family phosphatase [Ignavibacteria bacterium]MBT8382708.1 HAD family phosphatase [Ignavibacteria bacterium]MBT8391436.1 HAD family phosphatase [Ignavibacteria bacterium]NNJ53701.1 HAD family phosphatase [Ignavibacteriaceae bacterium]NNL21206.1 HAD family phosphatase [Ignavibacteriaceae bacterium]